MCSVLWKIRFFFEDVYRFLYRLHWASENAQLYLAPEKYIPHGIYCYVPNGKNGYREKLVDGKKIMLPYYGIESCVFHNRVCGYDLCMFNGGDCLFDSCKDCGINNYSDEEWEAMNPDLFKPLTPDGNVVK